GESSGVIKGAGSPAASGIVTSGSGVSGEPASGGRGAAARAVFSNPAFRWYELARIFIVVSTEMQSVAVGWQIYEITHRTLDLGLVGLAQFLPGILLFLVSGHTADRFDRKKLLIACCAGFA